MYSTPPDERFPLRDQRVVVTRARDQADELVARLRALGAEPIHLPAIRVIPPADDYASLDAAIAELDTFDWLLFTSANGVEHFCARLALAGKKGVAPRRIAAIGRATAAALERCGLRADLLPERADSEGLLAAFKESGGIGGNRLLLPRADIARDTLPRGLEAAGATVVAPIAYRTVPATPDEAALAALEAGVDSVLFTSGSTVRNVVAMLGAEEARALAERATVAAIGPVTAGVARSLGLRVQIVAPEQSMAGLVEALVAHVRQLPFRFAPIRADKAREVLTWAYDGPYAMYNPDPATREADLRYFTDPAQQIFAVHRPDGELVGFCSFGPDGRVPGYDYDEEALDVGAGMRPALTGQGSGAEFMAAILGFGRRRFAPPAFRATIAAWNERALRMAERAGFERGPTFRNPADVEFTVLLRPEPEQP